MTQRENIAIVTGGLNEEREISLKSAGYVVDHMDKTRYKPVIIYLDDKHWHQPESGEMVDKNDFSLTMEGQKITFNKALLIIHGSPVEDGRIQGYFETLGISYQCCDTFCSALTFHKMACKRFLQPYGVPMAPSFFLKSDEKPDLDKLHGLGYPIFVKPNQQGSSFGVTLVKKPEDLTPAIKKAFEFDDEIIVEKGLQGREFGCGVMSHEGEIIAFPLTEIIPYGEYFDWAAKYENQSDEITPPDLPDHLSVKCRKLSRELYAHLGCKGVVRFDYILEDETFYFLEANTTPGLSPTSIIPQMARAFGWTDDQLVQAIIDGID